MEMKTRRYLAFALIGACAVAMTACGTVSALNPVPGGGAASGSTLITPANLASAEAAIIAACQQGCQALPQAEDVLALIKANWTSGVLINTSEAIAEAICAQVKTQVASTNAQLKRVMV